MRNSIKNHILRGITLIFLVLAPLGAYSNSSVWDDRKKPAQVIDFQEALEGSLMGVIMNRGDGTSCGLIVEDQNAHSSVEESTQSNLSFLAFQEDLREAFAQHKIPLCFSSEDLETIAQATETLEMSQVLTGQSFEEDHVQLAGLGKLLFSTPFRAALTSAVGTCLVATAIPHSFSYFVYAGQERADLDQKSRIFTAQKAVAASVLFLSISASEIIARKVVSSEKIGGVVNFLFKRWQTGSFIAPLWAGAACYLFLEDPAWIILRSIFDSGS